MRQFPLLVLRRVREGGFSYDFSRAERSSSHLEIGGARLRANQGDNGMTFRQGVADGQPSGSARCTQNKNLHVRPRSLLMLTLQLTRNRAVSASPDLRLGGRLCRREHVACGCRTRYVFRTRDSEAIHPALMPSYISSAGPVWPFGTPNCSNASAHPARGLQRLLPRVSGLHPIVWPLHPRLPSNPVR
jgi:hypothetical protein